MCLNKTGIAGDSIGRHQNQEVPIGIAAPLVNYLGFWECWAAIPNSWQSFAVALMLLRSLQQ